MTRNILMATTAAFTLIGGAAFADNHGDTMSETETMNQGETAMQTEGSEMNESMSDTRKIADAELIRTRDITGGDIYTTGDPQEWSADTEFDMVEDGWNDIGEIEDVVLDSSGKMIGVVAEIGGFLDIADKHVMLEMNDVRLVPVDDQSYAVVVSQTEEELEQMEGVDEGFWN